MARSARLGQHSYCFNKNYLVLPQALELNTRIQQQNAAPVGFPAFVREGFNVKVPTSLRTVSR